LYTNFIFCFSLSEDFASQTPYRGFAPGPNWGGGLGLPVPLAWVRLCGTLRTWLYATG